MSPFQGLLIKRNISYNNATPSAFSWKWNNTHNPEGMAEFIEIIMSNPEGMTYLVKTSVTPSEFIQLHANFYNNFTPSAYSISYERDLA